MLGSSLGGVGDFGLQTFVGLDRDVLDECVVLALSLLVVVLLSRESDSDAPWDVTDSRAPDELVELRVDPDVVREHSLLREVLDFSDGTGRLLLEADLVDTLVQVDRAVARDLAQRVLDSFLFLGHCYWNKFIN